MIDRAKLSAEEWNSLIDDEKIPVKHDDKKIDEQGLPMDWAGPTTRGYSIAMKALRIINGERQDRYGNPEDTFKIIGDLWGAYLRALEPSMPPILPEDVANMMALMKMARIVGGKYCIDNDVDMLGYAMLGADMRRGDHD